MDHPISEQPGGGHHAGYETQDVNVRKLVLASVIISLVIVLLVVLLNEVFLLTRDEVVYDQYLHPKSERLLALRAHEDSLLHGYGVVDAEKGLYRIPIEKAMEDLVEESRQH